MRRSILAAALSLSSSMAMAAVSVGDKAPDFTLTDANGNTHQLSDFAGKTVVLEWTNHECPFVKKHYGAENMQNQQAKWTGEDVVWLSINSGAPGKQGHVDGPAALQVISNYDAKQSAYLLDPSGDVGRSYAAKTTPHMYVIDGEGTLRYAGAIDSIPSADQGDIAQATQYVDVALSQLAAGQPVGTAVTQPYGCAVKY